ncbi:RES family NAD+ phosphorylase [Priestia koreensis]|uniref:RES family NAD+ phosphorylase n=1 Tax=Priestia koreensis TaxID=284581 RepID=UPI003D03B8DC
MSKHVDIICLDCLNKIQDSLDLMGLDSIEEDFLTTESDEEIECNLCHKDVEVDSQYIDSLSYCSELIGNQLSKEIGGCQNCEGHDLHNYEHSMNDGESATVFELNIGQSIGEFLNGYEVPEFFYSYVLEHLKCKCGYGGESPNPDDPNAGTFNIHDEIFLKSEIDSFWGYDDYEPLQNLAERYGYTLTDEELKDFSDYIFKFPLLSLKHPAGIKLYSILKRHYQSNDTDLVNKGTLLYRGRPGVVNSSDDMWEPPVGKSRHGRYNSIGRSVLYCANSQLPIPYEIGLTEDQTFTLAQIEVLNDLECLDITEFTHLSNYFEEAAVKNEGTQIEDVYLLPNFIAECCWELGYKGVKYYSTHTHCDVNYALFNYQRNQELKINGIEHLSYNKQEWHLKRLTSLF